MRKKLVGKSTDSKTKSALTRKLRRYLNAAKKLHIETDLHCQPSFNGYVMGLSTELLLLHSFHDFMPDGYYVVQFRNIISVYSTPGDRHFDRMLTEEGLLKGLNKDIAIDLGNLSSAIASINQQFRWMIIETEQQASGAEDFYIGQLASISDSYLDFDHFDATGKWDSNSSKISFDDIAVVQFETPYIKIFRKYLSGQRPSKRRQKP